MHQHKLTFRMKTLKLSISSPDGKHHPQEGGLMLSRWLLRLTRVMLSTLT